MITCRDIKRAVAAECGVTVEDINGRVRQQRVALPRQISEYLCRTMIYPEPSLPWIGRQFGHDHTTVIHSCRRIAKLIETDRRAAAIVERCRVHVQGGPEAVKALPPIPPTAKELKLAAALPPPTREIIMRDAWHAQVGVVA